MGVVLSIVEVSARYVSHCKVYQTIRVPPEPSEIQAECFDRLKSDFVALYTAILRYLIRAHRLLSLNKGRRAVEAILKPKLVENMSIEIEKLAKDLEKQYWVCKLCTGQQDFENIEAQIQDLAAPLSRLDDQVANFLQSVSEGDQLKVLEWFSSIPFGSHHRSVSDQRTKNTGQWLLQHAKLKEWHDASYSAVLLLHGARKFSPIHVKGKSLTDPW